MATESVSQRVEQLPPNYLAQLYAGGGQNVPGIMPLLNQELVNRMMGFGVEGANPYTYSGNRIAGFSPSEREAMRMTAEGMGSYMPYFQRAEQMTEGAVGTADDAYTQATNRLNQAVQAGELSTTEAQNLLRQAPGIAQSGYLSGLGEMGLASSGLQGAQTMAGGAGVNLDESQNIIRGSGYDPTGAGSVIGGSLGRLGESAGAGWGSVAQFDPSGIASFQNPYEEQVVQRTLDDVADRFAASDIAGRAQAVGAGAFGGSRGRIAGEEAAKAAAREATQRVGAIRSGGYQDAARRAQAAFEGQQARQAGQANLLAGLGAQQSAIGSQLGQLGLGAAGQNLARGQALGGMGLAGQRGQLAQAGTLGQMAGQRAGMGTQLAGMGQNLASLYGTTAGGLGSLGGNLANIYGGAGRDQFGAGAQLGQLGMGAGQQMAGYGQGVSGLMGTDINRMMGMGGMQRGMDQRGLDLGYQNFVGQYNLPMQTLGQIGNMAAGWAPALGSTQLAQSSSSAPSNSMMQGLGTALTAYGALKS